MAWWKLFFSGIQSFFNKTEKSLGEPISPGESSQSSTTSEEDRIYQPCINISEPCSSGSGSSVHREEDHLQLAYDLTDSDENKENIEPCSSIDSHSSSENSPCELAPSTHSTNKKQKSGKEKAPIGNRKRRVVVQCDSSEDEDWKAVKVKGRYQLEKKNAMQGMQGREIIS